MQAKTQLENKEIQKLAPKLGFTYWTSSTPESMCTDLSLSSLQFMTPLSG
jgi:hypothetical protein